MAMNLTPKEELAFVTQEGQRMLDLIKQDADKVVALVKQETYKELSVYCKRMIEKAIQAINKTVLDATISYNKGKLEALLEYGDPSEAKFLSQMMRIIENEKYMIIDANLDLNIRLIQNAGQEGKIDVSEIIRELEKFRPTKPEPFKRP